MVANIILGCFPVTILPTSVLPPQDDHELVYCFAKKTPEYDVSDHLTGQETEKAPSINHKYISEVYYPGKNNVSYKRPHKSKVVKEALPTSVLPPPRRPRTGVLFCQEITRV